ncbi:MAG: hypothetical protein GX306_11860 [Clostridiales bacterium]|jgi:hypothetical protein|nr:hypothetical protein [Clostridiales bacterium]
MIKQKVKSYIKLGWIVLVLFFLLLTAGVNERTEAGHQIEIVELQDSRTLQVNSFKTSLIISFGLSLGLCSWNHSKYLC